jgi:hypothetical protein
MAMNYPKFYQDHFLQRDIRDIQTEQFLKDYRAEIQTSTRRQYHRIEQPSYHYNYTATQAYHAEVRTEPGIELTMPEPQFRDLVETHSDFHRIRDDNRRLQSIEYRLHADAAVRQQHPAVQKAWERYQLLLNTVK